MEIRCFNCEEICDIPEYTNSFEHVNVCERCYANLNVDTYKKCSLCSYYYLNTSSVCLYCGFNENLIKNEIDCKYELVNSSASFEKALGALMDMDVIGLDTEGNSLDVFENELLVLQLGNETCTYIFIGNWIDAIAKSNLWEEHDKVFIMHNAKFDMKILKHLFDIEICRIFDTMVAERILTCGISKKISLKDVCEKYLNIDLDKKIRKSFITLKACNLSENLTPELLQYSALDVFVLPQIYNFQKSLLDINNLGKIANLEFDVIKVLVEMELRGLYIDKKAWLDLVKKRILEVNGIKQQLNEYLIKKGYNKNLIGEIGINFNSRKELFKIFDFLRIKTTSTLDKDLAEIKHPFIDLFRQYRKQEKLLSSFGESFIELINDKTGHIHPSYHQLGADTGRFSCNKPNLQQIPAQEEYRNCFKAPKGRKLITCDYSQQELRILASLSNDAKFKQMYFDGVDLHSATASLMFDIPIEEVEKDTHRKVAKTINFGLAYGRGPRSLAQVLDISEEEAEDLIKKYFLQFNNIGIWLDKTAESARKKGYSTTVYGRKRYYTIPSKRDSEYSSKISSIKRKGKNTPIQGTASDMMKLAMVLIFREIKEKQIDACIINLIHDEIVVESAPTQAELMKTIVEECMIKAGQSMVPDVPIEVEGNVGDFWQH